MNDPLDIALTDFIQGNSVEDIRITSDLSEDDIMEVAYYFRNESDLPPLEKIALQACKGKVLDVGACVGAHTLPLIDKGFDVTAIDTSKVAMDYLHSKGVKTHHTPFLEYTGGLYDTLLLLMNGIGLAGKLEELPRFLTHCYNLLREGGKVICDSTDVSYFYEDDEGAKWIDLNAAYFGEFSFRMEYKGNVGEWFNWVYLDQELLTKQAEAIGFSVNVLFNDEETAMFLLELTK